MTTITKHHPHQYSYQHPEHHRDHSTAFTLLTFDDFCQTIYDAVEGVSGAILRRQYDCDQRRSYARVSLLRASDGAGFALIQIEGNGARIGSTSTKAINVAIRALEQYRRSVISKH